MDYIAQIKDRVDKVPLTRNFTIFTTLQHFSIITYKVEFERLRRAIPQEFEIYTILVNGVKYGLVSAVTFLDRDFRFNKLFPFLKFNFVQTNYRAYIIDKKSGEHCAWFFGTGIGSGFYLIPKNIWKMPWFYTKYEVNCRCNNGRYDRYTISSKTPGSSLIIDISETTNPPTIEGFDCLEQAEFILTHPVTGYFARADKKIGSYKIWHPKMLCKTARCNTAYFEKFEALNLLNKEEMKHPHSVLITDSIDFIIDLPPTLNS